MHLVIYTQKAGQPYIVNLPLPALLLALCLPAGLVSLLVYHTFQALEIQRRLPELEAVNLRTRAALFRLDGEFSRLSGRADLFAGQSGASPIALDSLERAFPSAGADTVRPAYPDSLRTEFYAVQIAAQRSLAEAEKTAADYRGRLDRPLSIERVQLASGIWYRVVIPSFLSPGAAQAYGESLLQRNLVREFYVQRRQARP